MLVVPYDPDVEEQMRTLYRSLNERDGRRYAAIEARKLGYGGQTYIRAVLGCDYKDASSGMEELKDLPEPHRLRRRPDGCAESHANHGHLLRSEAASDLPRTTAVPPLRDVPAGCIETSAISRKTHFVT